MARKNFTRIVKSSILDIISALRHRIENYEVQSPKYRTVYQKAKLGEARRALADAYRALSMVPIDPYPDSDGYGHPRKKAR